MRFFFNKNRKRKRHKKREVLQTDQSKRKSLQHMSEDNNMVLQCFKEVNENQTIQDLIQEYEEQLNRKVYCPCCKSVNVIAHGSYERNVVYHIENKKIETKIQIKRILCKECGHTHAILPDFLIPGKQHCLKFIENIMEEMTTEKSVKEIEQEYSISRQLMSYWKKELIGLKGKLSSLLLVIEFAEIVHEINRIKQEFMKKYYENYKEIYRMQKKNVFYGYLPT